MTGQPPAGQRKKEDSARRNIMKGREFMKQYNVSINFKWISIAATQGIREEGQYIPQKIYVGIGSWWKLV